MSCLPRSGRLPRRVPLNKRGRLSTLWDDFRAKKFARDKDEEGLIKCQDWRLGLPRCGIARPNMDLHHALGRDGTLLFDEEHLIWLTRECHNKAHEKTNNRNQGRISQAQRA